MNVISEPIDAFLEELADQYDIDALVAAYRHEALHCIGSPAFKWQTCSFEGVRALMGTPALLVPAGATLSESALVFIKGDPYDCTVEEACGVALWMAMSRLNKAHGGLLQAMSLLAQYFVERRSTRFFDITDQA